MRILVLFSTVEGHTGKIAETLSGWIEDSGHQAALTKAGQVGYVDPAEFDGVIACAPIHAGLYPEAFTDFIRNWKDSLSSTRTALVTVSLGIASEHEDEREEVKVLPRELEAQTGWKADQEYHAAGALKFVEYSFFKRWIMRRFSEMEGGPVDITKDHELTDWDDLKDFLRSWLAECEKQSG